jgi:ferredoxin
MALSRRQFFRFGLAEALSDAARAMRGVPKKAKPRNTPAAGVPPPPRPETPTPILRVLRPPGALPEEEFLEACTRCDACLEACPRESIRRAGAESGEAIEGTPTIVPELQPCWLCLDLPCIAAC